MSAESPKQQNMRRVALTSLAGTSIEWYDFFLYGTAAAVIFYCICSGSMLLVRSTHTEKSAVSIFPLCAIHAHTF